MQLDDSTTVRWDIVVLYATAIAGYPLVAGIPVVFGMDSRLVSVPYRAAILAISLAAIWRSWKRRELYRGALWAPLGAFWFLYVGRMLLDTLIDPVPLSRPAGEYFAYGIGQTFIPMIAMLTKPSEATLHAALRLTILLSTIAAVAVLAIGGVALLGGDLEVIDAGRFRLPTLDPISIGELGVSLAVLGTFHLLSGRGLAAGARLWLAFSAGVGMTCAGISASKGPLIALTVLVGCLLVLDWWRGHAVRALTCAIAIPAIGIQAALFAENRLGFTIISRFAPVLEGGDVESVTERIALLRGARDQFLANPLAGSSLEERVWLTYPHTTFVDGFMSVGLVGGLAYIGFHLAALVAAVNVALSKPRAAWLALLCVQYTITEQFSGSLYLSSTMWAILAAAVATSSGLRDSVGARRSAVPPSLQSTDGLELA